MNEPLFHNNEKNYEHLFDVPQHFNDVSGLSIWPPVDNALWAHCRRDSTVKSNV